MASSSSAALDESSRDSSQASWVEQQLFELLGASVTCWGPEALTMGEAGRRALLSRSAGWAVGGMSESSWVTRASTQRAISHTVVVSSSTMHRSRSRATPRGAALSRGRPRRSPPKYKTVSHPFARQSLHACYWESLSRVVSE